MNTEGRPLRGFILLILLATALAGCASTPASTVEETPEVQMPLVEFRRFESAGSRHLKEGDVIQGRVNACNLVDEVVSFQIRLVIPSSGTEVGPDAVTLREKECQTIQLSAPAENLGPWPVDFYAEAISPKAGEEAFRRYNTSPFAVYVDFCLDPANYDAYACNKSWN